MRADGEREECTAARPARRIASRRAPDPAREVERRLSGRSVAMQRLRARVLALAPLRVPVLVRGEAGSGRRALVRTLHALGRGASPGAELVHVLPRAESPRPDPRRSYHLEEVAALPRDVQARWGEVLRHVEERRSGAPQRIFASSARDLARLSREGGVDPALARPLLRFTLELPPLRDRREDVPVLARALADRACERMEREEPVAFTPPALRLLAAQPWPGNVHELARVVEKLVAFSTGERVTRADVAAVLEEADESVRASRRRRLGREREELVALIDAAGGNLAEVARRLRMSRGGVIYRAQKFGLLPKRSE